MNIKYLLINLLLILLCGFSANLYAADIQVKVDRNLIEINETFSLIFESNESPDDDPDFSPLEKDFQVLGTSTSSNMSIINGNYTRSKKWNVTLMALRTGTITIPSISFGSDASPSYQINIKAPQTSTGKAGETFISELDISTRSAYPQQQIIVTQRLLSSNNINAYEFSPLKTAGIEFSQEKLGDIKQYQTQRGGTAYLVLEQRHVIYPQSAGQLTIEPSIASARVAIQGNRGNRSTFDPFRNNTKTLRRSSEKKSITVKGIPNTFKGKHWLVAKEVQLVEEFPESTQFNVGEPITRTLLLVADGQIASQLPELITPDVKGLKQYPDKPLLKNNSSDTGISGMQQIKVAIIPSAAGKYTLPAISVAWWNTQTNKLEYAEISSRTFNVAQSTAPSITASQSPQLQTPLDIEKENIKSNITPKTSIPVENIKPPENTLLWQIISLLLTSALLFTLYLLWKKSKPSLKTENTKQLNTASLNNILKNLKHACDNNDAQATKNALLGWAQILFMQESIYSLGDLSEIVDADLAQVIQTLNHCLYRNQSEQWQASNLYDLCVKFSSHYNAQTKQAKKTGQNDQLESLYK